jgi:hypothetical protein
MIIGVLEDGAVELFDDLDHVMREWARHAPDVASEVIIFYDEDGVWLEPLVTMRRRWLGLRETIDSFTLRRNASPGPGIDPVGLALFESSSLAPNPYVTSLDELRTRFPFPTAG